MFPNRATNLFDSQVVLSAGGVTSIKQTQNANKVDNKPKMPIKLTTNQKCQ